MQQMALLYYPKITKTNLQLIKIDSTLSKPLGRFAQILMSPNLFDLMNRTPHNDNFMPFYELATDDEPPRLIAIKPLRCPHGGPFEQAMPRIPDQFLNDFAPSYGWVLLTVQQATGILSPNRTHLNSNTAMKVLENKVPQMLVANARAGEINIGTPTDFEVRLCSLEECRPGYNDIGADRKVAVMIHVANAPCPMPFYESWGCPDNASGDLHAWRSRQRRHRARRASVWWGDPVS